jgi:hypothetical protein
MSREFCGSLLSAGLRAARARDRDLSPVLEGAFRLLCGDDVLLWVLEPITVPEYTSHFEPLLFVLLLAALLFLDEEDVFILV